MRAIQLPFEFDAKRLLSEIQSFPEDAFSEIKSSHISPQGLFAAELLVPDMQRAMQQIDWVLVESPFLLNCPYLLEVLQTFESEKNMARIHRLQPHAKIQRHTDGNLNFHTQYLRVHIPLTTNQNASFELDGEMLEMEAGEAWGLNVCLPHAVENKSDSERIHLVIDCKRNAWWEKVLKAQNYIAPTEGPYSRMPLSDLLEMQELFGKMEGKGAELALVNLESEIIRRQGQ